MSSNINESRAVAAVNNFAQKVAVESSRLLVPEEEAQKIHAIVSKNLDVVSRMAQDPHDPAVEMEFFEKVSSSFTPRDDERRVLELNDSKWFWKGKKEHIMDNGFKYFHNLNGEKKEICSDEFYAGKATPDRNCFTKEKGKSTEKKRFALIKEGDHVIDQADLEDHSHLLRPMISVKMKQVIEENNLDELDVVQDLFVINANASKDAPIEEQLLVFSEKAHVIGGQLTGRALAMMPLDKQEKIIRQLCTFIAKTGMVDTHFGNFHFALDPKVNPEYVIIKTEGEEDQFNLEYLKHITKLTIVDTELHGKGKDLPERAKLGMQNLKCSLVEIYKKSGIEFPEELNNIFENQTIRLPYMEKADLASVDYIKNVQDIIEDTEFVFVSKGNDEAVQRSFLQFVLNLLVEMLGLFSLRNLDFEDTATSTMIPVLM